MVPTAGGVTRRPPTLALLLFWFVIAGLLVVSLRHNDGHFVYGLDDPCIHMAMAKSVALHGVWGIDPSGFTSSSSSPAWTALLGATYAIIGVHDAIPFLFNVVLGSLLLVVVASILGRACLSDAWAGRPRPVRE